MAMTPREGTEYKMRKNILVNQGNEKKARS